MLSELAKPVLFITILIRKPISTELLLTLLKCREREAKKMSEGKDWMALDLRGMRMVPNTRRGARKVARDSRGKGTNILANR